MPVLAGIGLKKRRRPGASLGGCFSDLWFGLTVLGKKGRRVNFRRVGAVTHVCTPNGGQSAVVAHVMSAHEVGSGEPTSVPEQAQPVVVPSE